MSNSRNTSHGHFLDRVRQTLRLEHLSLRTEESYLSTIRRFLLFHGRQHPQGLGPAEVRAYLTHLAVERTVASTQNVAATPSSSSAALS